MTRSKTVVIVAAVAVAAVLSSCSQSSSSSGSASSGAQSNSRGSGQNQQQGSAQRAGGAQGGGAQAGGARSGAPGSYALHFAAIPVQTSETKVDNLIAQHQVAGTVVPSVQSNVVAQVSGVVQQVLHHAGDWVKTGDIVVNLDDTQLSLAVKNAEASLENAQINLSAGQDNTSQSAPQLQLQLQSDQTAVDSAQRTYDSNAALYKQGLIAQATLDSSKSSLDQAKANLEAAKKALSQNQTAGTQSIQQLKLSVTQAENALAQAKLNLAYASIRAPFDGQISSVNSSVGGFAQANSTAFTIVSASTELDFSVPPSDAAGLKLGTSLQFSYGGNTATARISQAPSAPINGVVPIVAKISDAQPPTGTVGTVVYSLPMAYGALVPISALQTNASSTFVYTVASGKAHVQVVNVLAEAGDTAAAQGLDQGTQIIINPPPGLVDGAPVTPQAAPSGQAQSAQAGGAGALSKSPRQAGTGTSGTQRAGGQQQTGSAPQATRGAQGSVGAGGAGQAGAYGSTPNGQTQSGNQSGSTGSAPSGRSQ